MPAAPPPSTSLDLAAFVRENSRLCLLTGAGCSTASGLGDYRDELGQWKRQQPITGSTFVHNESARKRYWARSSAGWPYFSKAQPSLAHHGLAALHQAGFIERLITQNVDGLHQRAGHNNVIDLHGRLDTVSCTTCRSRDDRHNFQNRLLNTNPHLAKLDASYAPDGDADIPQDSFDSLTIPPCLTCGGILKPDVVFFGENVSREIVSDAMQSLEHSNGLLVVGSSLMVYSGYRFCRHAAKLCLPIAIVNRGHTRADDICTLKINEECGATIEQLLVALS